MYCVNCGKEIDGQAKVCPYCKSVIPIEATRCAHCTSELSQE